MILLIDNYDSFSYNLYQLIGEIDDDIKVIRNDELTIEEIRTLKPSRIILSPGPGRPEDAGIIIDVVKKLGSEIPILGVCLGHQAICSAFGATVAYAKGLCTASSLMQDLIQNPYYLKDALQLLLLPVIIHLQRMKKQFRIVLV